MGIIQTVKYLLKAQKDAIEVIKNLPAPFVDESKIILTEYNVANTFPDGTIELHKDLMLPKYEKLKNAILRHELSHDFNKGFLSNLQVDMVPRVSSWEIWKFMIPRPKTWIQILPFYYTKERGIVYDLNQMFFWSIIIIFVAMLIFLSIKFIGG
jgi:hypothetical protein